MILKAWALPNTSKTMQRKLKVLLESESTGSGWPLKTLRIRADVGFPMAFLNRKREGFLVFREFRAL